mmetsp:Transcript_38190/g.43079  ORF Transcript_38190/g.43079 Transcript_38190/m.43079 type:complete len:131 (+) Transcript_38190:165-557(+)
MFPQRVHQMDSHNSKNNGSQNSSSSCSSSNNGINADGRRRFFLPSVLFDNAKYSIETDRTFVHHQHQQMQHRDLGQIAEVCTLPSSVSSSHSSLEKALVVLNERRADTGQLQLQLHHQHEHRCPTNQQQQ